jgi:hypothetical protein
MSQAGAVLPPGVAPSAEPCQPVTNGLAIASLVLGIVGLATCHCLTAVPGVILGHIALSQIRRSAGGQTGRGLAVGGLVTGYIAVGLGILIAVGYALFLITMMASHRHHW